MSIGSNVNSPTSRISINESLDLLINQNHTSNKDIVELLKGMNEEANLRHYEVSNNFKNVVSEISIITTRLNNQEQINVRVDEKLNHLYQNLNVVSAQNDKLNALEQRMIQLEQRKPTQGGVYQDANRVFKLDLKNFPRDSTPEVTMESWGMNVVINSTNVKGFKLLQDNTFEIYCTNGRTKYLISTWLKSNLASLQSQGIGFLPGYLKWIQSEDVKTYEVHCQAKNVIWQYEFKENSGNLN